LIAISISVAVANLDIAVTVTISVAISVAIPVTVSDIDAVTVRHQLRRRLTGKQRKSREHYREAETKTFHKTYRARPHTCPQYALSCIYPTQQTLPPVQSDGQMYELVR